MTCAPNTNTTRKPCGPARVQGTEHLRNHHRFSTHDHTNYLGVDLAHAHTQVKDMDSHISTFCGHTHLFDHVPKPTHAHNKIIQVGQQQEFAQVETHTHTHKSPTHRVSLPLAPCTTMRQHKMPSTSKHHRLACVRAGSIKSMHSPTPPQ